MSRRATQPPKGSRRPDAGVGEPDGALGAGEVDHALAEGRHAPADSHWLLGQCGAYRLVDPREVCLGRPVEPDDVGAYLFSHADLPTRCVFAIIL